MKIQRTRSETASRERRSGNKTGIQTTMKHKSKAALLAVLCIALFGLSGCGQSTVVNEAAGSKMRKVASNDVAEIFVVEIDGAEYIVVTGAYKAAITPKVK